MKLNYQLKFKFTYNDYLTYEKKNMFLEYFKQ